MVASKILVPIDLSEHSSLALRTASRLAGLLGAKVLVLHVLDTKWTQCIDDYCLGDAMVSGLGSSPGAPAGSDIPLMGRQFEQQIASGAMDALRKTVEASRVGSDVPIELIIEKGVPYEVIVRIAREQSADMIVMPSHGSSGLQEFYLGSTTEKVVRHAPCSVHIVKSN